VPPDRNRRARADPASAPRRSAHNRSRLSTARESGDRHPETRDIDQAREEIRLMSEIPFLRHPAAGGGSSSCAWGDCALFVVSCHTDDVR
jgi:hypothetical protein